MFGLFEWIEKHFVRKYANYAAAAAAAAIVAAKVTVSGDVYTWATLGISISPEVLQTAITAAIAGGFGALSNWVKHRKDPK